jgi:hypothetical protein
MNFTECSLQQILNDDSIELEGGCGWVWVDGGEGVSYGVGEGGWVGEWGWREK